MQCVVRSLDGRWVNLGAILATWMTSDDNDHLEQNDRQVKLYKPMFNRTAGLGCDFFERIGEKRIDVGTLLAFFFFSFSDGVLCFLRSFFVFFLAWSICK